MDKKAVTFGSMIWVIALTSLFIFTLAIIGTEGNRMYGTNNDYTFGITNNQSLTALNNYADTIKTDTETGQSSYSSLGILQLTTLPHLINVVLTMTWSFVSGGFIDKIIGAMHLGDYTNMIIVVFRIIYFMAIAFILLRILTRSPV